MDDYQQTLQNMITDYNIIENIRASILTRMDHIKKYKSPDQLIENYYNDYIDHNEVTVQINEFIKDCEIYIYYLHIQIDIGNKLYSEHFKITSEIIDDLIQLEQLMHLRITNLKYLSQKIITDHARKTYV